MPMVRYQIRNEYGLADRELYGAADKDDPEALLEGVAMAGLVGVLRQLGDLAEFAAEIFHDLHEEVMATASRGHGLMLRVQQLEAEVPSVEKAIVSQISRSSFTNNDGIEWHPNLRMDQNLITRGDMPRFVLDSYEECRGPPRLFTLDKFDVAGAGACLKRYSDPSFFKIDFAASGMMETDVPREKKVRKIKKKGPRWKKGETLESLLISNVNSNSPPIGSDQVSEKAPRRTVKLKSRDLQDSDRVSGRNYREHLLEVLASQQKVLLEDSKRKVPIKRKLNGSSESAPAVHKIVSGTLAYSQSDRDGSPILSPPKQEMIMVPINGLKMRKSNDAELSEGPAQQFGVQETYNNLQTFEQDKVISESEKISEGSTNTYNKAEKNSLEVTMLDKKVVLVDSEYTTDGADGYRSDDIRSEQENFVDALNTLELEIETDSESKVKLDPCLLKTEPCAMDSEIEGQQEFLVQLSEPDSGKISSKSLGPDNLFNNAISSFVSESLSDSSVVQRDQEINITSNSPTNLAVGLGEADDKTYKEPFLDDELMELSSLSSSPSDTSCHLMEPNDPSVLSEAKEGSYNSCDKTLTYITQDLSPQITVHESQLGTADQNDILFFCEAQSGSNQIPEDLDRSPLQSRNLPEQTHLAEDAEELIPDDTAETLEIPKDLSQEQEISISKEVLLNHVEDSLILLTLPKEEELLKSTKEDEESSLIGRSPTNLALSWDNNSAIVQADDNVMRMENCASLEDLVGELSSSSVECAEDIHKHLDEVDSEDAEVQSDNPYNSSQTQDGIMLDEDHTQLTKDLSLPLNVHMGERQNSVKQETEASSSGTFSPIENAAVPSGSLGICSQKHIKEIPLQISEDLSLPLNVHMGERQNSVEQETEVSSSGTLSPTEKAAEHIKEVSLQISEDLPLPLYMHSIKLQNPFKDEKEACSSAMPAFTPVISSVLVQPDDLATVAEENVNSDGDLIDIEDTETITVRDISLPHVLPPEIEQSNDEKDCQRCPDVESTESMPMTSGEESFLFDAKLQSDAPDSLEINSAMLVAEDSKSADESTEKNSQNNILHINELSWSSDLAKDTVIVNDSYCHDLSSNYSTEASDYQGQIQKDHSASSWAFYQPNLEANSTSHLRNAGLSDVTLCTSSTSQVEEEQAARHIDSDYELPIEDSCDTYKDHCHAMVHTQTDWTPSIDDSLYSLEDEQDFSSKVMVQDDNGGENKDKSPPTDFLWEPASPPDQEDFQSQASAEFYVMPYHVNEVAKEDESPADDFLWEPASPPDRDAFQSHCRTELDAASYQEDQYLDMEVPTYSMNLNDKPTQQDSEPKFHSFSSDEKANELEIPPQNNSISKEQEQEASVSSDPQLSPSSSTPNISATIPMPFPSNLIGTSENTFQLSSIPQSEEPISTVSLEDLEKPPPLPPLQWRMGKLRPSSLPANDSFFEPVSGTNPFSEPSGSDKKHGLSLLAQGEMVLSTKIFSSLPALEVEHLQHGLLDPEGEKTQHLRLSEFPPIVDVESRQQDNLFPERKIEHPMENEKHIYDYDALGGLALQPSNPFIALPALQDENSQHLPLLQGEEFPTLQDKNSHVDLLLRNSDLSSSQDSQHDDREKLPTLECKSSYLYVSSEAKRSQDSSNDTLSSDREITQHLDLVLHGVDLEDGKGSYSTGACEGPIGQHLKSSVSGWTAGPQMPYPGYATSIEENPFAQYDVVPTTEDEKLNKKPYSIRNRPRNPLIDAVAAHDRSTLRKVSELIRSSDKPKSDERNSLLEQIRNKSFNLKPAVVAKPTIKGPATNLKVAAIIEKANAIRQACVGSDEEDGDEDRWSDS
ncbi:SCAR-like protein 1 [Typha latifolia]|uniref:SCAR-like protein 1 n=1 Tax=Typha latifolia TaxID=4733 RepID=UPI003C2E067C